MSDRIDSATRSAFAATLRAHASLRSDLLARAMDAAADIIDAQANDIAARDATIANLRAAITALHAEVQATLGDGADEHAWLPGRTAPEAVATLVASQEVEL